MATNATERIINHQDGREIVEKLEGIKQAILAKPSSGETTLADILANIRNGTAPENYPVGTEFAFEAEPIISTFQGNSSESATAGVTGVSVDRATYLAKTGTPKPIERFDYSGSAWHIGGTGGQSVTLSDYGITITGTPAEGDYITVSYSPSELVFQVAGYDHYEPVNPNVKHTMALLSKDLIKAEQQFVSNQMAMACSKKAMPAGKYKFTAYRVGAASSDEAYLDRGNGTYVFATTKQIPLNGGWSHTHFGRWNPAEDFVTAGTITTWDADGETAIETNIAVTAYDASEDADAVDLGTIASALAPESVVATSARESEYGYNNVVGAFSSANDARGATYIADYATSIIRQWLTSDKPAGKWWRKTSIFDLKPASGWTDQRDGFLYGLDKELRQALVKVKVISPLTQGQKMRMESASADVPVEWLNASGSVLSDCWNHNQTDGDCEVVEDGAFIPSFKELGGGRRLDNHVRARKRGFGPLRGGRGFRPHKDLRRRSPVLLDALAMRAPQGKRRPNSELALRMSADRRKRQRGEPKRWGARALCLWCRGDIGHRLANAAVGR